jgi:hypothetical protein
MDGHGRMIYQILKVLIEKKKEVDSYIFEVYDIDPYVNKWHRLFLPSGCKVIDGDILRQTEYPRVVYLNFCGMSHLFTNCGGITPFASHRKLLKTFKNIICNKSCELYLSSSVRGVKNDTCLSRFWRKVNRQIVQKTSTDPTNDLNITLVCKRGNFMTYRITENQQLNILDTSNKRQRDTPVDTRKSPTKKQR